MMPSSEVTIRRVVLADAPRLTELAAQLGYTMTQDMLQAHLAIILQAADNAVFVAEAEGRVIAWAHAYMRHLLTSPISVELEGLVVDQDARSQGIGARLVECVEAWGRDQGAAMIYVRSNVIRDRAHQFYLRLGYIIKKSQHTFTKTLT